MTELCGPMRKSLVTHQSRLPRSTAPAGARAHAPRATSHRFSWTKNNNDRAKKYERDDRLDDPIEHDDSSRIPHARDMPVEVCARRGSRCTAQSYSANYTDSAVAAKDQ